MALIMLLYASWVALTWWHAALPAWLWVGLAAVVGAWWGSVQHECIHGHPTRWQRLNAALATPPFGLWLPYRRYRHSHLAHHRDERLTDPLEDPESRYWTAAQWQALTPLGRLLVAAQATLLGRLVIGPFWSIPRYWRSEWGFIRAGNRKVARIWAWHALWVALVLAWAIGVCGVPWWQYLTGFVLLATSLTLIRSFAEHRAAEAVEHRTAIVERGGVLGLLFLFNNLHVVHHAMPREPWYRLPRLFAARREEWVRLNGGLVYGGYGELFRRFLFRPHDQVLHPMDAAQQGRG
jgi:fatty acid desaturase